MAFHIKTAGLKSLALAGALSFSTLPTIAADDTAPSDAQERMGESVEKMEEAARGMAEATMDATAELMDAIEDLVDEIQSYEPPTMDEDGNIIIRKRPMPSDDDVET